MHEEQIIADALRYFAIGEGVALLLISAATAYLGFHYDFILKWGLGMRWMGRFVMVAVLTQILLRRVGDSIDWATPMILTAFTSLLVGAWLMRSEYVLGELRPDRRRIFERHRNR